MRKIYYYYDPAVKSHDDRYYVDIYCTNGKKKVLVEKMYGDTPTEALGYVRKFVERLNRPKPFFGNWGRLSEWIRWKKKIRNQKKFKV